MTPVDANRLHRKFVFAAEPAEIVAELNELDAASTGPTSAQDLELRVSALRNLRRLIGEQASAARDLIIKRLLPLCVKQDASDDFKTRIALSESRKLAGEWLNDITGTEAETTILESLVFLLGQLDSAQTSRAACWTLSEIGFRTQPVIARLFILAEDADEEISDTALETIAALGVTGNERQRCLGEALARARQRISPALAATLVALPDPQTIFALSDAWLERNESDVGAVRELLLSIFSQVGAVLAQDEAVDQACRAIARLHAREPSALDRKLRLASNLLTHLDSPLATQLLLDLLSVQTEATDYDRWLVMLRLEECCRPRQLAGIKVEVERQHAVIDVLMENVLEPGETTGRERTARGDFKLVAVRTAFLLGRPELEGWLRAALARDRNPYVREEIMEFYAGIRVSPLPDPIPRLITEERQLGNTPADNIELLLRLAASRVARSAGTQEAFNLLLRPGLTREGSVMLETVEGLVAATLALGKDATQRNLVLSRLFEALAAPVSVAQVSAIYRAISAAAHSGWLAEETWQEQIFSILTAEPPISVGAHDLATLVGAVAALPARSLPTRFFETLAIWGRERDDRLRDRALQALIELGKFSEHEEWIAPKLGLTRRHDNAGWEWSADSPGQIEWAPLLIVELYAQSPRDFTSAFRSVLADERWFPSYDVTGVLLRLVRTETVAIEEPIATALLGRARQRNSSRFADTTVLGQVALLIPKRFALEDWSADWPNWLSEARVALADALGLLPQAEISADARRHAAGMLVLLAQDGEFSVRRAALRGLDRLLPEQLASLCIALSSSECTVEERTLAAEALNWLRNPDESRDRLAADVSKRVRDAARNALAMRERRKWALNYQSQLFSLTEPTNAQILDGWKYGNALTHTGDDETIEALRKHLQSAEIASCVRFRLNTILKETEKHWEAVTKKWPQPILALPGSVETAPGKVQSGNRAFDAVCTLWHISPIDLQTAARWGGVAEAKEEGAGLVMAFGQKAVLTLNDQRVGDIFVQGISSEGLASFRGIGRYPSSTSEKL